MILYRYKIDKRRTLNSSTLDLELLRNPKALVLLLFDSLLMKSQKCSNLLFVYVKIPYT